MGIGVPIFCILVGFPAGWLVLMIFIWSFLQILATAFGAYVTVASLHENADHHRQAQAPPVCENQTAALSLLLK